MAIVRITLHKTVNRCTCDICGHVWESEHVPKRCSKCKRATWNGPDKRIGKFKRIKQ